MPHQSALAIANEFLRRRASDAWPQQMFIQKLVYFSHGWTLAITNDALIDEQPEAWDNGPVYRSIWDHIRDYGYGKNDCLLINNNSKEEFKANLSSVESQIIDHVWNKYKNFSASELSDMTHLPNTPWFKAYFQGGRNKELPNDEIKSYFVGLAKAGRAQHDRRAN